MKISNTEVYGFRAALRAMRNPKDSWDKSDSRFGPNTSLPDHYRWDGTIGDLLCSEFPNIGPNDLELALKLIRGGSEHRKFLRQIIVWVDFTLPRYVWQELDTYKVATVRNSCSTMHKLGHRDLTGDDFEKGGLVLPETLTQLNILGRQYRENRDYTTVRIMKAILPEGFLQRATWTGSYETLLAMHRQRKSHRLPEWSGEGGICEWIRSLPYMTEFIAANEEK